MAVADRVRLPLLLGAALALGGCLIGPNFERPPAAVNDAWLDATDSAIDTQREEYHEWWRVFGDARLEHLIDDAYAQNLDLRIAGIRVLESRAQLGLAIGELYPQQQQAIGELSYNKLPVAFPYNAVSNTYWQSYLGLQAGWEIDLWGKIRRGIEGADEAFLASVAGYDDVLVTLTGDVASTYVQIRTLETRLAVARENIERQRLAVRIAENRYRGGVVTKRDVYQAENVLGSTEAAIPELTIELQKARNALSLLLGKPPGGLDELLAGSTEIPVAPPQIAVGIPAELLRRRPDIRHVELQAAAQCAEIGLAKADLLPAFSLVGSVGTFSSDIARHSVGDLFTAHSLTYAAGPTVQWNVLNYGRITNNVRVQDARFQALLVGYQNAVLSAQQEVEDAITVYLQSRQQTVFLEASVEAARGALRIAMNQYKDGTADFTTVLTAEENLYKAQDSLAVARGNIPLGLIGAYRALGGGWQLRDGRDFVPLETREQMAERTNWGTLLNPELLQPEAPGLPAPEDTGPARRFARRNGDDDEIAQSPVWSAAACRRFGVGGEPGERFFTTAPHPPQSGGKPPHSSFPVDLYTQIGLVLIIALAAKNAILIVEFTRQLRSEGMATVEAAVEATRRRFRPILMTSLAFILGVVPLLTASGAGAASQQAIGTVVFGGMLASTLLAIPFVPVFYVAIRGMTGADRPDDTTRLGG